MTSTDTPARKATAFAVALCVVAIGAGPALAQRIRTLPLPATPAVDTRALDAPARAQAVEATGDYLARMDTDADGRVSLSEYQDWLTYAFDAMDRDRDGVLVAAELPGGKGRTVTRIEHRQRLAERFRKQDLDRDGFLDSRELAAPPQ